MMIDAEYLPKRLPALDSLKLLCAIDIVVLHYLCLRLQHDFLPLTRFAVPCFFMISGYCLFDDGFSRPRLAKRMKYILRLIVIASSIYFAYDLSIIFISGSGINLTDIIRRIREFIVYGMSPFSPHLWYLNAYILVLGVIYISIDRISKNIIYWSIPLCLLIAFFNSEISVMALGTYKSLRVINFIGMGLPYFLLGALIKDKGQALINPKFRIQYLGGFLLMSLLTLEEARFLAYYNAQALNLDAYIFTPFAAISLLLFVLSSTSNEETVFSKLGKRYSMIIYIMHFMILSILIELSVK